MPPDDVIEAVKASNLRGRGGAGFPTGMKWGFIPQDNPNPKYLVVNADESEPGTCKDIPLMMASPHTLVEGVIISSYAIRANHAFIYVRGEVLHVVRRLQRAVQEAYLAGHLGKDIHGSGYDLDLVVHAGAGAYICGEETALLDSLEGRRGQPRLRPPFPAVAGLYASPTVINNVESIASVPSIIDRGAEWFASMGTEKSKGYGIFSLSGHVTNPGQFEAPLGITLRELIDLAGGMREGHELKFWTPGGSSTPMLTAEHLDVPLDFEARRRGRLDARHPRAADLRRDHLRGPRRAALDGVLQARVLRQVHALPRGHLVAGADAGQPRAGPGLRGRPRPARSTSATTSWAASFCALGDGATSPITSSIQYFRDEYLAHLTHGGCPVRPRGVHDLRRRWRRAHDDHPREVASEKAPEKSDEVTLTIDGVEVSVPKNTLVIRAAEQIGVQIPRFCDHPLLAPVGACRQCLVEVPDAGNGRGDAEAAGLLHDHRRRGHGGQHPGHLRRSPTRPSRGRWSSC